MENKDILVKLGLSEKESSVYMALLEQGASSISTISRYTGIHRPLIYKALPTLKEKGLVSEIIKGKQKKYIAESPAKLKNLFSEFEYNFKSFLPELEQMHQFVGNKPIIKFLEGKKGISFVFEDLVTSLKKGDIFYRYSSAKDITKANDYLPKNYRTIRDQKQLERFVMTSEKGAKDKKPNLERAMKTIPEKYDLFDQNITQLIYGDKIAFIDYNTKTAFIVENKIMADFQRKIFKLLYSKL